MRIIEHFRWRKHKKSGKRTHTCYGYFKTVQFHLRIKYCVAPQIYHSLRLVNLVIIVKLFWSSTDSKNTELDSPYENVQAEGSKSRAFYQNDVFAGGAENMKEEGQYEELKEGEIRKNECEKPYSKLTRI